MPITQHISIGKGSQSNFDTNLSYGASNVSDSPFFERPANKAIKLLLPGLDDRFQYYQIGVIKRTAESGAISSVEILFPRPVEFLTTDFTYTGFSSQVLQESTSDEILNAFESVHKVTAHEIEDRKLFLAGTTAPARDYSLYQRYASAVKTSYVGITQSERDAKRDSSQAYGSTLCPDEIYAFAIVYVHDDGTESPAFPIPGRPADLDMTGHTHPYIPSHTNWDTDNLIGDANVFNDSKTNRWQVYSTATIETAESSETLVTGHMGYYQTTTVYPEIESCDGEDYWGQDYWGNDLAGEFIRHHRVPAQYMYVGSGQAAYPQYKYYPKFENVELPANAIGWKIVVGDRSEERTVLDRGFLRHMNWDPTDEVFYHAYID